MRWVHVLLLLRSRINVARLERVASIDFRVRLSVLSCRTHLCAHTCQLRLPNPRQSVCQSASHFINQSSCLSVCLPALWCTLALLLAINCDKEITLKPMQSMYVHRCTLTCLPAYVSVCVCRGICQLRSQAHDISSNHSRRLQAANATCPSKYLICPSCMHTHDCVYACVRVCFCVCLTCICTCRCGCSLIWLRAEPSQVKPSRGDPNDESLPPKFPYVCVYKCLCVCVNACVCLWPAAFVHNQI